MDRRTYLRAALAGGAFALAGCGGNGNGDGETTTEAPMGTTEEAVTSDPPETTEVAMTPDPSETTEVVMTPDPSETTEVVMTPDPPETTTAEPVEQVVEVGAGGLNFRPESFTVSVGGTVRWVWRGSNHNVVPDEVPSGTDWAGSPGGPGELYDEGYAFEHSFASPGEYTYYCNPHRGSGMTGSFTVGE